MYDSTIKSVSIILMLYFFGIEFRGQGLQRSCTGVQGCLEQCEGSYRSIFMV